VKVVNCQSFLLPPVQALIDESAAPLDEIGNISWSDEQDASNKPTVKNCSNCSCFMFLIVLYEINMLTT
jgi:hypothetical protein